MKCACRRGEAWRVESKRSDDGWKKRWWEETGDNNFDAHGRHGLFETAPLVLFRWGMLSAFDGRAARKR